MALFKQVQLSGLTINNPSSLQFGPDGRLYVSQDNGVIAALTIASDGAGGYAVTGRETISHVRFIPNHNDDGTFNAALTTRQVTGILVAGTAEKPVLYVSSSDPRIGGGTSKGDTGLDTNSGTLSMLTKEASGWVKTDLVVGLPRSEENHAVNGLQFNPENGHILLTVGGQTNAGAPSQEFGHLSEYAYGSSIVDIDVATILAMPSQTYRGQTYKYALPTLDDPTRTAASDQVSAGQPEVFGGNNGLNQARLTADSPVQLYSTGFRNLYDIAVNQDGQIYGIDNGGNPTWGGPPLYRQPDGTLGTTPTGGVTNAINDGGGSINKAPLHRIEEGYYGGHVTPIRANPNGAGLYDKAGNPVALPADWAPVPESMVNPVEGYYLPPGANRADLLPTELETPLNLRGEMATFDGSVNGIDDYRADTFDGEMRGDLLAASLNDDSIYRINLSDDGTTVLGITNLTPGGVLGNGNALDVHAAPETGPFAGTVWVASYGGGITVLVPDAGSGPAPVSQDADEDGLSNTIDPFAVDASNGQSVQLTGGVTLTWGFSQNEAHPGPGGIGNLGFTGVMTNGLVPYTQQYNPNRTIMGGAASGVLMQDITDGSPLTNNQLDAYQFGIDIGADVATYTVTGKVNNPFDSTAPANSQSVGFFIGTGDQANYVRLVAGAATVGGVANTPVIEMLVETGDVVVARHTFAAPVFGSGQKAITASDSILLHIKVDPVAGTVTPGWTVSRGSTTSAAGDLFTGEGTAVSVSGALLAAIQGNHTLTTSAGWDVPSGLAVGIIGTSEGPGQPFPATWNSIAITSTAKPAQSAGAAELIVAPDGLLNVSTFNPNTISLSNLAQSNSDLVQVVIDLSTAILPDGVFFDPNAAGGNAGKSFQINSQVGVLTGTATFQNGSAATGYRQMTLSFTDFNPGESIGFSADIDPDTMTGFGQSVIAGDISGAELAGSRVTFRFADGSTTQAELFGSGIAQAEARGVALLSAAPVLSLQNATTGNLSYPAGDPTISVIGAAGATVRVEMMTVDQLNVPSDDPFFGNSATSLFYETIVLDQAGRGTVSASLTPGQVLVVAAAQVNADGRAISAVSQELRIIQRNGVQPVSIEGTAAGETLTGTAEDDGIDGKGGADTLRGLAGNDYLNGGAGADWMAGGVDDDVYLVDSTGDVVVELAGEGVDGIRTMLSSYTLGAQVENLTFTGTAAFTGIGNALANVLIGGPGSDRLEGLGGIDIARGGLGNDTYVVENAADLVIELAGEGTDRVLSQVSYVLPDHVETLQLTTSKPKDGTGSAQANTLIGNAAVNVLDGRGGADVLTGGGDNDIFVVQRGEAEGDRVTDFTGAGVAGGDMLRFSGYGTDARLSQVGSTDRYTIHAGTAFGNTVETIQITGVTNLRAGDYSFALPFNAAPTDITLSRTSVPENLAPGSVIGTLASVDIDPGDASTFTLLDNAAGRFQIVGNELLLVHPLDHEVGASHEVRIEALDTAGNRYAETIIIQVSDVNDTAPAITSASSASIDENTTRVLQLTATDPDTTGEPTSFRIDPAIDDGALFTVAGDVLSFRTAPDFEGGHSPLYSVGLIATDGVNSSTQLLSVEVRNTAENGNSAPTGLALSAATIAENAAAGTIVGQLSAVDPDAGDSATFSLLDDAGGRFAIASGSLVVAGALDWETNARHSVTVQVTDSAGATFSKSFIVNVSDVKAGDVRRLTAGDDVFTYQTGLTYDTVDGLAGLDLLRATAGGAILSTSGGALRIDLDRNGSMDIATVEVERVALTGTNSANIFDGALSGVALELYGLSGDDTLIGGSASDLLDGGAGKDRMTGGLGNDTYDVNSASDVVIEASGGGVDTVRTSLTKYDLDDNVENAIFLGTANVTLQGNSLANSLTGGLGADLLDGDGGADLMIGGGGNDTYLVDQADDMIVELAGQGSQDRAVVEASYTLADQVEILEMTTRRSLNGTGNSQDNILRGNDGTNQLDGRGGADVLTGGAASDTFVFRRGEASGDRVTDFGGAGQVGGDQLRFTGYGAGAWLEHVGTSDTYVIHAGAAFGGVTETIRIDGVTNLASSDWVFV